MVDTLLSQTVAGPFTMFCGMLCGTIILVQYLMGYNGVNNGYNGVLDIVCWLEMLAELKKVVRKFKCVLQLMYLISIGMMYLRRCVFLCVKILLQNNHPQAFTLY